MRRGKPRSEKSRLAPTLPSNIVCVKTVPRKWGILCYMARTNIDIDDRLIRKALILTGLKTKREIVAKALELLVRSENRKGILRYYGKGVWRAN